ncbi:MAG TPA: hydrogenase maturation protease [Streptosporangiaceae bacterium]
MTREITGDRTQRRVLVACVGNIFLGDDGFGVEVAKRLAGMPMPDGVRVVDYGISGMHLAYDLADGYETTILVDAAPRGKEPGTVSVIEVDPADHPNPAADSGALQGSMLFDGHGMQPDVVFGILDMLGAKAGRMFVVGCEPATVEYGMELSPPVAAAVGEAARIVLDMAAPSSDPAAPSSDPAAPSSVTAGLAAPSSVNTVKG